MLAHRGDLRADLPSSITGPRRIEDPALSLSVKSTLSEPTSRRNTKTPPMIRPIHARV